MRRIGGTGKTTVTANLGLSDDHACIWQEENTQKSGLKQQRTLASKRLTLNLVHGLLQSETFSCKSQDMGMVDKSIH